MVIRSRITVRLKSDQATPTLKRGGVAKGSLVRGSPFCGFSHNPKMMNVNIIYDKRKFFKKNEKIVDSFIFL